MNKKISTNLKTLSILLTLPLAVNAKNLKPSEQTSSKYIEVTAGIAQPTTLRGNAELNSTDPKYVGSIAFGKRISDQFSIDFGVIRTSNNKSYNYSTNSFDKFFWRNKSTAAMVNMNLDLINDQSNITPYIKVGAGISRNKSSDYVQVNLDNDIKDIITTTYKGKSTNSFAWQVGAGFNFKTHSKFDIQLQYMFANLGKSETQKSYTSIYPGSSTLSINGEARKGKLQHHVITIGARFKL